ncbi:MAG: phosphoglucomutase, partial [Methanoregula sp.]
MLFGSSGIRRRFDQTLVNTALDVGAVLGADFGDIIIGTDTRTTSPLLARLIVSGVIGSGGQAYCAGIAPTPAIAFTTRLKKAGCMITASHNPEEYNGLKLFNPDGSAFTLAQQAA